MEDGESNAIDLSNIRRKLWIIILLTLLAGPFSFVYCGQLSRAIRWQLGLWLFGLLSFELIPPTREFPQEREEFGEIRWQRVGQQLH